MAGSAAGANTTAHCHAGQVISTRRSGARWERVAESFLRGRGLRTVTRNFRCRLGEIDLIMRDADCLVFTEVRYRRNREYGSGAESVTTYKQRRIILTAMWYLKMYGGSRPPRCRFDVVSLGHANGKLQIDWIPDAFEAR